MYPLKRIDKVCEIIAGQSPPSSTYNQDGKGLPFFQGKADFNEKYPTIRYWCTDPKRISEVDDILMSVRAPVGSININNTQACIGRGIAAIRCGEKINRDFLYHYLRYQEREIADLGTGSTFKAITIKTLRSIKVPLPPLKTQEYIAGILDDAAALRDKTAQLLEEYDLLAQSIFLEMFGDRYKFEEKELGKIITLLNSKRIPVKASDRANMQGEYPYYGASGIIDYVDEFLFDETCLLIGEDGANLISRSTPIAFIASGRYWVNNHAHVISKKSNINIIYLMYYINSINLEPYITGSAQPKLNATNLRKIPVPIPSKILQNEFAEKIALIEQQKELVRQELKESEDLFNCLLQKAFKGELVPESQEV